MAKVRGKGGVNAHCVKGSEVIRLDGLPKSELWRKLVSQIVWVEW